MNDESGPDDYVMTASGGLPGELIGGWRAAGRRAESGATMDVEYGFSCMGYELAAPWGAAMARAPDGVVTTLLGDGSYLMLNSELFSAAFAGHGFVAVVCDNDGYAVIDRLQRGQGAAGSTTCTPTRGPAPRPPRWTSPPTRRRSAARRDAEDVVRRASLGRRSPPLRAAAVAEQRPCGRAPGGGARWTESGAWRETGTPASPSGHVAYVRREGAPRSAGTWLHSSETFATWADPARRP